MFLQMFNKQRIISATLITALSLGGISLLGVNSKGEPGGEEDPFIAESLLNSRIGELTKALQDADKKIEAISKSISYSGQKYEVIEVKKGNSIICGESTEIVLRSGKASVIASEAGGLADLTSDSDGDLKSGRNIQLNHLILIPRDDGRGIKISSTSAWVIIKGKYEIR